MIDIARLLTCAVLFVIVLAAKKMFLTHANPVAVYTWPWVCLLFGQQIVAPSLYFNGTAGTLICCSSLALLLGAALVSPHNRQTRKLGEMQIVFRPSRKTAWTKFVGWMVVAIAITNGAFFFYFAHFRGVGTAANGLVSTYSLTDAVQNSEFGPLQRAANILVYGLTALFCMEWAAVRRPTLRAVLFVGIVVAQGVIMSSKLVTLVVVSIMLMAMLLLFGKRFTRIRIKTFLSVAAVAVSALTFFFIALGMRAGADPTRRVNTAKVATIGSPSVLSIYLENEDDWVWGRFSGVMISGPLSAIGVMDRGRWDYSPVYISPEIGDNTNIVTGLYQITEDFGVAGAILVFLVLGLVCSMLFWRLQRTPSMAGFGMLLSLLVFLSWQPICAMSYYNYWYFIPVLTGGVGTLFFRFQSGSRHAGPELFAVWLANPAPAASS